MLRAVKKHFTATGFVVDGSSTILHWHRKLNTWMPPGGHIEEDEDPIEALLREIREEAALEAEVVTAFEKWSFGYPRQVPPPRVILVEDIGGPGADHQHIDLIYYCRSLGPAAGYIADKALRQRWVPIAELIDGGALDLDGQPLPIADDVRELAIDAIRTVGTAPC
ncbi:MAG: NUDIX domain-containing protein [Dehalococcoidia bacterium]|nr:NUDIX domain-containing protein [Dehalococcoidia bacterium]